MVWHIERGTEVIISIHTLSKTPRSQNESCAVPLKWNAFEVSAFLTEEASHVLLNGNTFEVSAIKLKGQTEEDYRIGSI